MRTLKYEMLRPDEILAEKKACPVIYMPIGPLEWHGPHLPLGMDPINAYSVALRVAQNTGGLVLPTLYWGTERERSPEMLKDIGFNGDEWIVGMDFPNNSMPSFYAKEDVFGIVVREYLRMLVEQGYKLIVIMNGHGASNHIDTLQRLAAEFSNTTPCKVEYVMALITDEGEQDLGHASRLETSIMKHLYPECVDTDMLPPKDQPLKNVDFAIVDGAAFGGNPNESRTVVCDPRDASEQQGRESVDKTVRIISGRLRSIIEKL